MSPFVPRDPEAVRETWPPDLAHFSASSESMFLRCPEQWRHVYGLGERRRPNGVLLWGRVDHQTIGADFQHKLDTHEHLPDDEFADRWVEAFSREIDQEGGLGEIGFDGATSEGDKRQAAAKIQDAGVSLARTYRDHIGRRIVPAQVEARFELEVVGVPVPVIGFLDLVGSWQTELGVERLAELRVIERKTVNSKVKAPKSDWLVQGYTYQRVTELEVEWQQSVRNLDASKQFVVPGTGPLVQRYSYAQARLAEERLRMVVSSIAHLWTTVGVENPWPDAISHPWACGYCGWGPKAEGTCHWWQ